MPRTDKASRMIATPINVVYKALIDPVALCAWVPPGDMTGRIEQFDPRPGGSYRMVLTYPASSVVQGKTTSDTDVIEARFVDLVTNAKVTYAVDFVSDDSAFDDVMVMSWCVSEVDGATLVEITAENVPDAVSVVDHAAGLQSSLAKLAEYLAK